MFWFKKKNKQPKKIYTIAFCDEADLSTQFYSYRTFESKEDCISYIKRWWRYIIERKIEKEDFNAYKVSGGGAWLIPKETTQEEIDATNRGIELLPIEELYK